MCHFRHHAHSQPLIYAGLQDITAHVDFTAMADAALEGGLDVLGYTSQARFLMNAGLAEELAGARAPKQAATAQDAAAMTSNAASMTAHQKLVHEAMSVAHYSVQAL